MKILGEWENFYVIVGSSAGALIGLQFVVMTLVAENPIARSPALGKAFGTPTIIHFSAVLLLSAIVSAPWHGIISISALMGVMGAIGLIYSSIVFARLKRQTEYQPVFEDWLFNVILPLAAYASLTGSAFAAPFHPHEGFFGAAATALLLLFVGIHNAWDGVVYHIFNKEK